LFYSLTITVTSTCVATRPSDWKFHSGRKASCFASEGRMMFHVSDGTVLLFTCCVSYDKPLDWVVMEVLQGKE